MCAIFVYVTVSEIKTVHAKFYMYFFSENFLNFMACFVDGFQLPQVCRVTVMRQFIFYH